MVATIDYAFFPHIFSEVIAQSDFKTQNKLRFLSSSTKHEVDRHQHHRCNVRICFDIGLPSEVMLPLPVTFKVFMSESRPKGKIPSMWAIKSQRAKSWPQTTGLMLNEEAGIGFALRHPVHRVIANHFDWLLDYVYIKAARRNNIEYNSPIQLLLQNTSRICLKHCDLHEGLQDVGYRFEDPPAPPSPTIPPCVRKLQVIFYDSCSCRSLIQHTCPNLCLDFGYDHEQEPYSTVCSLSVNLLNSWVMNLIVQVQKAAEASEYLSAISNNSFHPDLRVTARSYTPIEPSEELRLLKEWRSMLKVPVRMERRLGIDGWMND